MKTMPPRRFRSRTTLRWVLALSCGLALGCDRSTGPGFPGDQVVPFTPPPRYALWWQLVEQCSGRTGQFASVHWYHTQFGPLELGGEKYDGYWWEDGNRIVLAYTDIGPLARHEMLHALLRRGDHPLDAFAGACDGVVEFDPPDTYGLSAAQASQAQDAAGDTSLAVTISAVPAIPSVAQYDHSYAVIVTATNTTGHVIRVPVNGFLSWAIADEEGIGPAMETRATHVFFGPGQQRRAVLDDYADSAGTYHTTGDYLGAHSPLTPITVKP
jgi:hypothetical protein